MSNASVDDAVLDELRSIMGDEFSMLIDIFVTDSTQRIITIEKAIAEQDAEELRSTAHGFKGSALNISATRLTELCKQLESMGRDNQLDGAKAVFDQVKTEFQLVKDYLEKLSP